MKKLFFTLAAICCCNAMLYGQSTTSSNIFSTGSYLGWAGAQNLELKTSGINRLVINDATGFLGVGTGAPASLLNLSSAATGNLFRTDGSTSFLNRWQLYSGGIERFSLHIPVGSSNVILQSSVATAVFGINTGGVAGSSFTRMFIRGEGNGSPTSGYTILGNNLDPFSIVPRDRLHLYHDEQSSVAVRYGHSGTGAQPGDGTQTGILANNDFRITQFEGANTDIWTPGTLTTPVQRFRIQSNGQILVGNSSVAQNVIVNSPISGFSAAHTSLFNIRGPINSCGPLGSATPRPTILYGYTSPDPTVSSPEDGFRIHMNLNFNGNSADALVFEKTDGGENDPDGYIAFTNTGADLTEEISAYIDGTGKFYSGKNLMTLANRFTIDSEPGDASLSGLRFTDLTSAASPATNPGTGVLSVNATGDVIYVASGTGAGQGFFSCSNSTTAPDLLQDSKLNLNNYNLYFENNGTLGKNHIGIGYSCNNTALPGKLSVLQSHPASISSGTTSVHALNADVANSVDLTYTAVYGEANGAHPPLLRSNNVGGDFKASNANDNYAIRGEIIIPGSFTAPLFANNVGLDLLIDGAGLNNRGAEILVQNGQSSNTGVFSLARTTAGFSSLYNTAGVFSAADALNDNIGINTSASGGTNAYGIYTSGGGAANSWSIWGNGDYYATGTWNPSDRNLKENIQEYSGAEAILSKVQIKTYEFRTSKYPHLHLQETRQIGIISQELEKVFPEAVKDAVSPEVYSRETGELQYPSVKFKAISYEKFIPVLIKGHQEQQSEMKSLSEENTELKKQNEQMRIEFEALNSRFEKLESCLQRMIPGICQAGQGAIEHHSPEMQHALSVILADKQAIILNQNVPNPFAESTVITYSIPASVQRAQIQFFDASGRLLQATDIPGRGVGTLQVYANDLSAGTYTYSLIADGQPVATKRLVKQ